MEQKLITLKDKTTVLKWVRNMHIVKAGCISRIAENDTDSAFYRVGDMPWFKEAQ